MLDFLIKTANARTSRGSDEIKNLGRRAARRFIEADGGSLTDAVSSIVQEEGDLNRDQIRRVVEAANQATWSETFASGDGNREASFDPADAERVLEAAAPDPIEVQDNHSDYDAPPPTQQSDVDKMLSMFDGDDVGPKYDQFDPASSERITHEKVSHAARQARSQADLMLEPIRAAGERLYDLVKQAHYAGEPFLHIVKAVDHACMDREFAADLLSTMGKRLASEGINIDMTKQAAASIVVIDEEHDIVKTAAELEHLAIAFSRASEASETLEKSAAVARIALLNKIQQGR